GVAVALLGRPVAAAAARAVADDVTRLHLDRTLGGERSLDAVADQHVLGRLAVVAAQDAPRAAYGAVGEHGEGRRPVEEEVLAQPEPAPKAARPVRVVHKREPRDAHRIVELRLFDGRVLGALAVRLYRGGAVD